jgi:hypothetical protein
VPLLPPLVPLLPLPEPVLELLEPPELPESLLVELLLLPPLSLDAGAAGLSVFVVLSVDFASGFDDEYRSLYQPLPLSWNAVREISRSSAGCPQASQSVLSGSAIRCWYSNSRLQALHLYS